MSGKTWERLYVDEWVCTARNSNAKYRIGDKVTMGEDKPITQFYHSVGDAKIEPLGKVTECEFRVEPAVKPVFKGEHIKSMRFEDFFKNVLGFNYHKRVSSENIISYDYIKDEENNIAITTIYWADKSTTTCRTTLDNADQYTGFMIAIAKYAMGNKNEATNAADYWINKRPAQLARKREKVKAEEAEIKRITDKRRKRREQYRLRLAAIRRKEAYEAAKLANEKYGVPLDFKEDGEDK